MINKGCLIIIHPHFTLPGGAGKVILELGKRLVKHIDVKIICQSAKTEVIKNYLDIEGLEIIQLNGPITSSFAFWAFFPLWQRKTFSKMNKILTKYESVKIMCNVFPANWIALPYKKSHPQLKIYWYCHEPSAFIHIKKWRNAIQSPIKRIIANLLFPLFSLYDKKVCNYADALFTNSEYSRSQIKKIYLRESKVIYPGVDVNKFIPIPFNKKDNYILTVGRLTKFKNIDILIRALQNTNKDLKLKIVGDGEEKLSLRKLVTELQLSDRIDFLSGISDNELSSIYSKAKLFVICSHKEPFGMVPIEAMAAGTAVIADNSGGPREIITDNKDGMLVDCKNVELLSSKINLITSDLQKNKSLSINAVQKVKKSFSWDVSAEKLLRLLEL